MIDQDRPSPPPSWYEQPAYVDCSECGQPVDLDEGSDTCKDCIAELKADHQYDLMIESEMRAGWRI